MKIDKNLWEALNRLTGVEYVVLWHLETLMEGQSGSTGLKY